MGPIILVLRPQPGADATAARARALGLEAVVTPLFAARPLDWEPPDRADVEATMLTSANAPRHAGPATGAFLDLPCYAVGEATAAAGRDAGFTNVRTGPSDGAALIEMLAADGLRRVLHLSGKDHIALDHPEVRLLQREVYAAEPVAHLPAEAEAALAKNALVLLHSPRAAASFSALVDEAGLKRENIRLAAISEVALAAAGGGWSRSENAPHPRDEALLELAAKLCQT